jgi:hypothetical protein
MIPPLQKWVAVKAVAGGMAIVSLFAAGEAVTAPSTLAASGDMLIVLLEKVGVLGVLIWYLWYVTSRDRPRMEKAAQDNVDHLRAASLTAAEAVALANKDAVAVLATAHEKAVNTLVTDFRAEFRDQRSEGAVALDKVVVQMEKQSDALLEVVRSCAATSRVQMIRSVAAGEGTQFGTPATKP